MIRNTNHLKSEQTHNTPKNTNNEILHLKDPFLHFKKTIQLQLTLDIMILSNDITIKSRRKVLSEMDSFPPASLSFIITKSFQSDYKENGFSVL